MRIETWITVTILLAILATLLQIAGYVAPMWIWLDVDTFRVGVGLWHTVGCGTDGTCNTTAPDVSFGYSTEDTWDKPQFDAVRGLLTIGVCGGVLLVLFLIVYKIGYGRWTHGLGQLNIAAFVICILTWLCVLAGLIVFCAYYWPVVGTSPLVNSVSFPWSLLLCLFAALFFIIVGVLIRLKCRARDSYLKHAIPTSGDSKMDLNPVTKQGVLHRYFTPLHYNENRRNNLAIAHHDESTMVPGMHRRLIGAEDRLVSTYDNTAVQGHRAVVENGVSYRYLPIQNGGVTRSETVVRRSLPTAVVTYTDGNPQDINRLDASRLQVNQHNAVSGFEDNRVQRDHQGYTVVQTVTNHVKEASPHDADLDGGAVTRDVTFQNGRIVTRDLTHQASPRSSPHDSGLLRVVAGNSDATRQTTQEHVTYTAVKRPPVANATRYVTSAVTDARETRLADNSSDARFTSEGRLTADAEFLTSETRQAGSGLNGALLSRTESSQNGGGLLQYTTHTATYDSQFLFPEGSSVRNYDPTYIYRPYSQQQIY